MPAFIRHRSLIVCCTLGAVLALNSCALFRVGPPRIRERSARPITLPAPVINDEAIYGIAKLDDPQTFKQRLDDWASLADADPKAVSSVLEKEFDFDVLRPGANAAFIVWRMGMFQQPPVSGIISVVQEKLDEKQRKLLARMTPLGGYHVYASNEAASRMTSQSAEALLAAVDAPMSDDLQFGVNVASLMKQFGPMLRQQMEGIKKMVGEMKSDQLQQLDANRTLGAQLDSILTGLEQTRSLTIGASIPPEALSIDFMLEPVAGSDLEKALSDPPVAAPDLARFLTPGSLLRVQTSVTDMGQYMRRNLNFSGGLLMADPDGQAALDSIINELGMVGRTHTAQAIDVVLNGKGLSGQMLIHVEHPDEFEKILREKAATWMNSGPIHEFYRRMGIEFGWEETGTQRTLKGRPVRQFALKMRMTDQVPQESRKFLERFIGESISYEMIRFGNLFAVTLNQPVEGLVEALYARQNAPLAAMHNYPAGGFMYADVDGERLLRLIASLNSEAASLAIEPPLEQLTMAAYHQQGRAYYALRAPRKLLGALATLSRAGKAPDQP